MSKDNFLRNCELWSRIEPEGARAVMENDTYEIEICKAKNGQLNLRLVADVEDPYFHNESDPLKEAVKWYATLDLSDANLLFVYGIGLGYYYDVLEHWLRQSSENYLIFIEDSPEVIKRLFETERAEMLLKDPQVRIYLIDDFRRASEKFDKMTSKFMGASFKLSANQLYLRNRSQELIHLNTILSFLMNMKLVMHNEFRNFGLAFYRNYFTNLFTLPHSYLAKSLWGKFQGIPAIICGAGPSLGKNIDFLKTLQKKALIFAGSTAVNALNAEGFNPHFGVGIDPNPEQLARIVSNEAFQTPYFINFRMNSYAMNAIHGDHLYVGSGGSYKVADWLDKELEILGPKISEGYNVVNYSLSLALEMGCNPIILVGVDLAYTEGSSYAKLKPEHPLYRGIAKFTTKSAQEDLVAQQDIYGNSVFTLWKWLLESVWFSNAALNRPGVKLINATEGGIGFPGVEHMTLAEAASACLQGAYDFEGMIHADIQMAAMPKEVTREHVIKLLTELKNSLSHCNECCREIAGEYKRLGQQNNINIESINNLESDDVVKWRSVLDNEIGYIEVLSSFNEHLVNAIGKGLERLSLDQEWLSLEEICQQHSDLHHLRYVTLYNASTQITAVLDAALNIYQEQIKREKRCGMIDQHEYLRDLPGKMTKRKYLLEESLLTIIDSELGIDYSKPFDTLNPSHHSRDYYPDGSMRSEQYYFDGKLHGPSSYYSEKGQLLSRRWFIKGLVVGEAQSYYEKGQLYSLTRYSEGLLQGPQEYYYQNGILRSFYNYEKGEFDGPVRLFYPNGQLKREIYYSLGKRQGIETLWSYDGKKIGEVEYDNDIPIGKARFWNPHGSVVKCVTFDDSGSLIKTELWDNEGHPIEIMDQKNDDYFDSVTKKIQIFTQNLDLITEGIAKLIPTMQGSGRVGDISLDNLRENLSRIQEQVKNLKDVVQTMVDQVGLNPNNPQEAIWKTPSMQKILEEVIDQVTKGLKEHLDNIHQAFIKVLEHSAADNDHKK